MKNIREQNIEALIARGRQFMALQGKPLTTERQYLHFVRRFLWFTFTQPRELTSEKKFENWLTHLVTEVQGPRSKVQIVGRGCHRGRRRRVQWRRAAARYWNKRAAAFREQGLTTRGTSRKYVLRPLGCLHGRVRARARERIYRAAKQAVGLTCRGNRIRGWRAMSDCERAWREFRAQMPVAAEGVEE